MIIYFLIVVCFFIFSCNTDNPSKPQNDENDFDKSSSSNLDMLSSSSELNSKVNSWGVFCLENGNAQIYLGSTRIIKEKPKFKVKAGVGDSYSAAYNYGSKNCKEVPLRSVTPFQECAAVYSSKTYQERTINNQLIIHDYTNVSMYLSNTEYGAYNGWKKKCEKIINTNLVDRECTLEQLVCN